MMLITGILLPVATYLGLFFFLGNRWGYEQLRLLLLRSAALSASYLFLALEALSLIKGVNLPGLAAAWLLPGLTLWLFLLHQIRNHKPVKLPRLHLPISAWEWMLFGLILIVLVVTFTVAWITPPQTWDSLTYHLSRVTHWVQNSSIGHYPTGIERQNSMSPGAELLVLNSFVLTGGDRLANFPQWLAMLGSLVAGSLAAKLLGANSFGQWLAAGITATIPMSIVQASSTATDYLVSFWTICAAVEVLHYSKQEDPCSPFFASLAAGLALLTKPIAIPYLLPFAVWMIVLILKRSGLKAVVVFGTLGLIVVGTLNAGYLGRNLLTYGHIANPADLDYHANQMLNPAGLLSNLSRNAGMQAGLPGVAIWNETLFKVVLRIHILLGLGLEDPQTTLVGYFQVKPPSTQEDFTTNPYHAYLFLGIFLMILPLQRRLWRAVILFAASVAIGFILFSLMYKWQSFGARFHLLFFVLFAPLAGVVLSSIRLELVGVLTAAGLLLLSFPWLFSIDSRPIFPKEGQEESILSARREKLYFSNNPSVEEGVRLISADILKEGCSQVGLRLHGDDPEYLFWIFLRAPRDTLQIEWIVAGTPSTRYQMGSFQPCAIICSGCQEANLRDLDRRYESSGFTLYMGR